MVTNSPGNPDSFHLGIDEANQGDMVMGDLDKGHGSMSTVLAGFHANYEDHGIPGRFGEEHDGHDGFDLPFPFDAASSAVTAGGVTAGGETAGGETAGFNDKKYFYDSSKSTWGLGGWPPNLGLSTHNFPNSAQNSQFFQRSEFLNLNGRSRTEIVPRSSGASGLGASLSSRSPRSAPTALRPPPPAPTCNDRHVPP